MDDENKEVDLLTALTISKCVIRSTVKNLMETYEIPNYLMNYVMSSISSDILENEVENMVANSVKKKEDRLKDDNNEKH